MCFIAATGSIAGGKMCVAGCGVRVTCCALRGAGYTLHITGNNGLKFSPFALSRNMYLKIPELMIET